MTKGPEAEPTPNRWGESDFDPVEAIDQFRREFRGDRLIIDDPALTDQPEDRADAIAAFRQRIVEATEGVEPVVIMARLFNGYDSGLIQYRAPIDALSPDPAQPEADIERRVEVVMIPAHLAMAYGAVAFLGDARIESHWTRSDADMVPNEIRLPAIEAQALKREANVEALNDCFRVQRAEIRAEQRRKRDMARASRRKRIDR